MSSKFESMAEGVESFAFGELEGKVVRACLPADLEAEVRRLIDPGAALETVYWDRNYLYRAELRTAKGPVDVVVKQFRPEGLKDRLRRLRGGGGKAERSWRMGQAFHAAGVPTAEPLMLIEPRDHDSASFFITQYMPGVFESRYLLRAVAEGTEREEFPEVDLDLFLTELGEILRRMHGAGLFHRDLSIGNVVIRPGESREEPPELYVIDLNRARQRQRLGNRERTRDLCRLELHRPEVKEAFLRAYWGEELTAWRRFLYHFYHQSFFFKIKSKRKVRGFFRGLFGWMQPRQVNPHIPRAPEAASVREKIVWDHLSDQPHQHAGKLEKLAVRLADAGSHLRQSATALGAAPRILREYRRLRAGLHRSPVAWDGVGVCVRPWPQNPGALLEAVDDLGVGHVLLRLHPWEEDGSAEEESAEEELARELHGRGLELTFALPQNRELVRDPERWRRRIEELAERFTPYGRHFQVGQAINRSKWGAWTLAEYLGLARSAEEILRRHEGVEVLGPAVIDFEPYATAAVLNLPGADVHFDALASLLYVDRRGAPENQQLGFDTVGKVLLLQAMAKTARHAAGRSWITEVNWPLWEGPHSPAGQGVAVDEATQADYLARFYLLALGTGQVERVFWWQLIARGYGLACPEGDGALRRRPSFETLQTLVCELEGSTFLGPLEAEPRCHLYHFRRADGGETVVGWSEEPGRRGCLPRPAEAVVAQRGWEEPAPDGVEVELGSSVWYFRLEQS